MIVLCVTMPVLCQEYSVFAFKMRIQIFCITIYIISLQNAPYEIKSFSCIFLFRYPNIHTEENDIILFFEENKKIQEKKILLMCKYTSESVFAFFLCFILCVFCWFFCVPLFPFFLSLFSCSKLVT